MSVRAATAAIALLLFGCSVVEPPPLLVAGDGVELEAAGEGRVLALDRDVVPVADVCEAGALLRQAGGWRCENQAGARPDSAALRAEIEAAPVDLGAGSTVGGNALSVGPHPTRLPWTAVVDVPAAFLDGDDDTFAELDCPSTQVAIRVGAGWRCQPALLEITGAAGVLVNDANDAYEVRLDPTVNAAVVSRADHHHDHHAVRVGEVSGLVDPLRTEVVAGRAQAANLGARFETIEAQVAALETRLRRQRPIPGYALIPAGEFTMGSPVSEAGRTNSEDQVAVRISRAFWMKTTEVTVAEYYALRAVRPALVGRCGLDCPAMGIRRVDAIRFANLLSAVWGFAPCYDQSDALIDLHCEGFRLPTEAEWEYAARAGTSSAFFGGTAAPSSCGSVPHLDAIGWHCGNAERPRGGIPCEADLSGQNGPSCAGRQPVAQLLPNRWGLYDMHGNAEEWVEDRFATQYPGILVDPLQTNGGGHVARGGDWTASSARLRSAARVERDAASPRMSTGFRLVRVAE